MDKEVMDMSKTAVREGRETKKSLPVRRSLRELLEELLARIDSDEKMVEDEKTEKVDPKPDDTLLERLASLEKAVVRLEGENTSLEKKLGRLSSENGNLKKEIGELRNRLSISEGYIVKLANTPK
jgi:predicted RNase H-like nuclease (RuvC/YqgF family)